MQGVLKAYTQTTSVLSAIVVPAVVPEAIPSDDTDIPSRENAVSVHSKHSKQIMPTTDLLACLLV